jgi:hypothetical protein
MRKTASAAAREERDGRSPATSFDAHRARLLGAFFLIYFVWGSNFLRRKP